MVGLWGRGEGWEEAASSKNKMLSGGARLCTRIKACIFLTQEPPHLLLLLFCSLVADLVSLDLSWT